MFSIIDIKQISLDKEREVQNINGTMFMRVEEVAEAHKGKHRIRRNKL